MKCEFLRRFAKAAATAAAFVLALAACSAQAAGRQESPQAAAPNSNSAGGAESGILIAYFTLGRNADYGERIDASTSASLVATGNELCGTTEYIARLIQQNVGGDLHSIMVKNPYPADFNAVIRQNHAEAAARADIELSSANVDMSKYSTVFVGFPVWATGAPRAIFSFLSGYDFSGKTVIPFCTHDGYGAGRSFREIAEAAGTGAAALDGIAIDAKDALGSSRAVAEWLERIGVKASNVQSNRAITVTIGGIVLEAELYDTPLAQEISGYFPLTLSMRGFGGREYYGDVDFYPAAENLAGGRRTFENGHITYCEPHHNMAIFYAQTERPTLSVDVIPIGMVTSDLSVFETLPSRIEAVISFAE